MKRILAATLAVGLLTGSAGATTLPPLSEKAVITPTVQTVLPPSEATTLERDYFNAPRLNAGWQRTSCRTAVPENDALSRIAKCD